MIMHASCVAINGRGVLIEGASGAGKSDLALRLIDRGACLVSDDQVTLARRGDRVYADAPATIAGKMEVRGLGIMDMPCAGETPVVLLIRLGVPERLPEFSARIIEHVAIPELVLGGLQSSAPVKVEWALRKILQ